MAHSALDLEQIRRHLIMLGSANIVWVTELLDRLTKEDADKSRAIMDSFTEYFGRPEIAREKTGLHVNGRLLPVTHAIPVVDHIAGEDVGFVIPISIEPSPEWHISDAFGRFGFQTVSPHEAFDSLLDTIERSSTRAGWPIPVSIRWRQAFALRVLSPVHMDVITGASLQLPLLVALLRAAASLGDAGQLPFGQCPVFASGTIDMETGRIGTVGYIAEKASGFLREYGSGLPAFLTPAQVKEIGKKTAKFFRVFVVDSADDLFTESDELAAGLSRVNQAPHSSELDGLLARIEKEHADIRFERVEALARWMTPHCEGRPLYQLRLEKWRGKICLHQGRFGEASRCVEDALRILNEQATRLGADEVIELVCLAGELGLDACDWSRTVQLLRQPVYTLPLQHAAAKNRAAYWGTLSQLYRAVGDPDAAVRAAELAVNEAELGLVRAVGILGNFNIHAHLFRARVSRETRSADLDAARKLLAKSVGEWAPRFSGNARISHLKFCAHYEAEIARLSGVPYHPKAPVVPLGNWDHPVLFTLLSATRNLSNDQDRRRHYARLLVQSADQMAITMGPLFSILRAVYEVYEAMLNETSPERALRQLAAVLCPLEAEGLPGWKNYLTPYLDNLIDETGHADLRRAEELCDAIPYH